YNRINNYGGRIVKARIIEANKEELTATQWAYWQRKIASWNVALRQKLQEAMGERTGNLLGSMLLGGRNELDEEIKDVFTANGLSHLLSVSGTHLVLLTGLLSLLLKPLPSGWRTLFLIILLTLYACLCGLRPAVLRALLMSTALLLGSQSCSKDGVMQYNSRPERGYLLCLVALVLLIYKPLWLLDIGFQLSFGATAGLLWLAPACTRLLPQQLPDFLAESLAMTMAAQLVTLPLLVANFHQLSFISLISNLLLVPLLEFSSFLAIIGTCVCFIPLDLIVGVGQFMLKASNFFLEQVLVQGNFLAWLPYTQVVIGNMPLWCGLVYYAMLLVWCDVPIVQFLRNQERRLFLLSATSCVFAMLLWQQYGPAPLTVYFLSVGQGDCVVITTPKHQVIVYDTGGLPNYDTGKRIVAPFLKSLGKGQVDALLLSHYDYDHVGGAVGLLEQLEVKQLLLPQEALDANNLPIYEAITRSAQKKGTRIKLVQHHEKWDLGKGAVLNLLVPATIRKYNNAEQDDDGLTGNAASTVAALTSPNGSLLLTGDLGSEEEKMLELGHYTVFKAGHHGSRNSNSEDLLQKVQPLITVISCGLNNRYHHPHQETLERLAAVGTTVLRTDKQNCIKVVFDESGIKCYSYRYNGFQAEVQYGNKSRRIDL
ncbi:MAG: DNA internalization-related competence protein ComEC/Rec2, partial [Phascolarctobacterium sp.]